VTRRRRLVAATAWMLALAVAAVALQWAGRGPLTAPPLTDPGRWPAWLDGRDPVEAAFGILRVFALVALWYLVLAAAVGAVLRMVGAASLVGVADRLTIAPVRRMLAGSLGLGLAASGVVAVAAPALRAPVAASQQPAPSTTVTPPATVTMHRLGPEEPVSAPADAPVPEAASTTTTASAERWTVKPGECFWSIAEAVLSERSGRPPSDAEILPFWQRLIEANRHELVHGGDPDLILPGQSFVVPTQ
jgi:nucleoid-associated protein YgaU